MLGLIAVHRDARAAEMTTIAQAQMEHGGQGATSGSRDIQARRSHRDLAMDAGDAGRRQNRRRLSEDHQQRHAADRFVGAKSDATDHVEIHEMSMSDGVMKMRPLPDGLEIKPGETVELKSGGYHLMFMDLKQPLKQGDTFKATLQFEKAGSLEVNFNVNALGATADDSPRRH